MYLIQKESWKPADDLTLEVAASDVVRSDYSCMVTAGPGAGKTELLAQKAAYLLQTGVCIAPQKILALSYKRDAATNLSVRVTARIGFELSSRLVSITYDKFSKMLLDRFRSGLPDYQPNPDYEIVSNIKNAYTQFFGWTGSREQKQNRADILHKLFVDEITSLPLDPAHQYYESLEKVWRQLLAGNTSTQACLTFPMIGVLAEYIIRTNPQIRLALASTFSHVFLDEFQDTTTTQYRLLNSCFKDTNTVLTAVGDEKQRIMSWAGAKKNIFQLFKGDYSASSIELSMNFRSAPRLIEIQKVFVQHMTGRVPTIVPSDKWDINEGECEIWLFDNPEDEALYLKQYAAEWFKNENLHPRDVCVLVRQLPEKYGSSLLKNNQFEAVKLRNENKYQDLLSEDISRLILALCLMAYGGLQKADFPDVMTTIFSLRGTGAHIGDQSRIRKDNRELVVFLEKFKLGLEYVKSSTDLSIQFTSVLNYLGIDRLRDVYPQYRQGAFLENNVLSLVDLIWTAYQEKHCWVAAVRNVLGESTVPLMTVHKSKGLEYDTVVFVGLEDSAFWNFNAQKDDETCNIFVALSRAKRRAIFTFCSKRNTGRNSETKRQKTENIDIFYSLLKETGLANMRDNRTKVL